MSGRIGKFVPERVNVPIPKTEEAQALVRRVLKSPGGLDTATIQIAKVKVQAEDVQFWGLFPNDPYADDSPSPKSISPADSHSGKDHQPAPAPVHIAHHTEVPAFSQEFRRWAQAFHNPPVDEDKVQKVRDLLAGKPPAEAKTPEKHPDFTERRKTLPRNYASSGDLI
jgi:hypothetical protein